MIDTIERDGEVIGFDGELAQVRLAPASSCSGCGSRGTCGSGNKAAQVISISLPAHVRRGDRVTLAMPSSSIALAALLGYLLPPTGLLAGAMLGALRAEGDMPAVVGAALGLVAGLLLARTIAHFTIKRGTNHAICGPYSSHGEQP